MKVVNDLATELSTFYEWEKVKEFVIVDPWMELLYSTVSEYDC